MAIRDETADKKVSIWLQRRSAGRVIRWVVNCQKCGELLSASSKKGASQVAVSHAEETHDRYVRIHVPVND